MKKLFSFFLAFFLIMMLSVTCWADYSVKVSDYGFSLTMPSALKCVTRETHPADIKWDLLGVDGETAISYFEENDIYLDAFPDKVLYEIVVFVREGDTYQKIWDFSTISDDDLEKLFADLTTSGGEFGLTVEATEVFHAEEATFYVAKGLDPSGIPFASYYTVVNGNCIQITGRTYSTSLDKTVVPPIVRQIADSIHFQEKIAPPETNNKVNVSGQKVLVGFLSASILCLGSLLIKKAIGKDKAPSEEDTKKGNIVLKGTESSSRVENEQTEMAVLQNHGLPNSQTRKCSHCGSEVSVSDKYCMFCGQKLD